VTLSKKKTEEFIKLYDDLADQLFRHCFFKVSSRELALDLVQESFARTWQYLASGKKVDNVKGFLFKVANNLVIDEYRKKKVVSLETLQEQSGFDAPVHDDKKAILNAEVDTMISHINKLDAKYKDVILMRYVNDFSPKEIAEILGDSENAISVRINRGMKKVQEMIHEQKKEDKGK
jgi:RNA polymerase sigma-70 factor (ECF subfamily)